ncbi:MAG TPA: alkaline phosphatase family protein [Xanthomonadaceae bacterium]|jgi:hypothetical protein|nr:alkaline phosphatase family protein [Xanthomonadaceae bacterium]
MKKNAIKAVALSLLATAIAGNASAIEGPVPTGVPHLNHVYLIMMENHIYGQVLNNKNTPFITSYAKSANLATNYYAIAHPSLTNYLEVTGGSNFGVLSDIYPNWHNATCIPNLASGKVATDNPATASNICPISGSGTEAATPVIDMTNEAGPPGTIEIDGVMSIPAATNITGKTIADQLAEHGKLWRSYQESLPARGANLVDTSDGVYDNTTDFSKITPVLNPALNSGDMVALYAVKHNPFVYFRSVQEGSIPNSNLLNTVGFDGAYGLYADLKSTFAEISAPALSFIVPNQCNDQHGRGNAGAFCNFDPDDNGSQAGLNPALMQLGDVALKKVVTAIKASPAWQNGKNAIVVVWDENDYSLVPNKNQVVAIVDTNYGTGGKKSAKFYTHYSLLKTLEGALGLPCLNHACDANVSVMSDLFAAQ